jgi:hypothetical protein
MQSRQVTGQPRILKTQILHQSVGRPTGGKVYGFDSRGELIEAEAEIIREMFRGSTGLRLARR